MHFFTCFSLGDLTFSIAAQNTVCARRNPKTKWMCHLRWRDELSFSRYNTDYCGASSSPDHRVRKLTEFQKDVIIFNGDVMVISQRAATWRRQRGWLIVYWWSFFSFIFLYRNCSQPLLIRAPNLFYRHTCHDSGLSKHVSNFDYLLKLFHRVQKTATNAFFHVFSLGDFIFSIT